tara:strand:- start:2478 stop:2642 length:165 start_codon:yes stop_codon:yes gene_type:complete
MHESQKKYDREQKAKGRVRVNVRVPIEDRDKLIAYAKQLVRESVLRLNDKESKK